MLPGSCSGNCSSSSRGDSISQAMSQVHSLPGEGAPALRLVSDAGCCCADPASTDNYCCSRTAEQLRTWLQSTCGVESHGARLATNVAVAMLRNCDHGLISSGRTRPTT